MQALTVDGRPHVDFDPAADTIHIAPRAMTIKVEVTY